MTAGLQIFGAHGIVQIDSDYSSLMLRNKLTFDFNNPSAIIGGIYVYDIAVVATIPIIALSPRIPGLGVTVRSYSTFGGTTNISIWASPTPGMIFDAYVFDINVDALPPGSFQVYRADGTVAFSSAAKSLKIVQQATLGSDVFNELHENGSVNFGTFPGRRMAYINTRSWLFQGQAVGPIGPGESEPINVQQDFFFNDSDGSKVVLLTYQTSGATNPQAGLEQEGAGLLVDVTDY